MAYARQFLHHFEIPIFSSVISWTLTSVKETTLVTRIQTAPTTLDHMYATVSLDILEMDKTAQVNLMISFSIIKVHLSGPERATSTRW